MSKILAQFSTSERFVENDPLETTYALLPNNETTKDLVYTTSTTVNQPKNKAYYVRASMPYNQYSPTAFLFKIRSTINEKNSSSGVEDPNILDYENDTHQVVKYAETPYNNLGTTQSVNFITCSYDRDGVRRYNTYTYHQLETEAGLNISETQFNNILEDANAQLAITQYIQGQGSSLTNVSFDIQELDNSSIDGLRNYIIFDFIFISKIPWNQFICCYDRRYSADKRVLNGNNSNIYVQIYPFKEHSDLIDNGNGKLTSSSNHTISKVTIRAYNGDTPLKGVPFYINNQGLKTGPDGEYTLKDVPIYNFGIPNFDGNKKTETETIFVPDGPTTTGSTAGSETHPSESGTSTQVEVPASYRYDIEYEYDSD